MSMPQPVIGQPIRRTEDALNASGLPRNTVVRPLYGAMSFAEQAAAIRPSPPGERKVVLYRSLVMSGAPETKAMLATPGDFGTFRVDTTASTATVTIDGADAGGSPITGYEYRLSSDNGSTWSATIRSVPASTSSARATIQQGSSSMSLVLRDSLASSNIKRPILENPETSSSKYPSGPFETRPSSS